MFGRSSTEPVSAGTGLALERQVLREEGSGPASAESGGVRAQLFDLALARHPEAPEGVRDGTPTN
jgi:hypothetical protein